MTISISYHLERESHAIQKLLPLRGFISSFISKIFNIHTQRIEELAAALDGLYLSAQGSLKVVDTYTPEIAREELRGVKGALQEYRGFYNLLEQCQYFSSDLLRSKAYNCLSSLYDIEIELKKQAFAGQPKERKARKSLIQTLTNHSEISLQNSLSRLG
jgi:hypothetical protein